MNRKVGDQRVVSRIPSVAWYQRGNHSHVTAFVLLPTYFHLSDNEAAVARDTFARYKFDEQPKRMALDGIKICTSRRDAANFIGQARNCLGKKGIFPQELKLMRDLQLSLDYIVNYLCY